MKQYDVGTTEETSRVRILRKLARAHHSLKLLRERIGDQSELNEALDDIEVAMNFLAEDTGGFL